MEREFNARVKNVGGIREEIVDLGKELEREQDKAGKYDCQHWCHHQRWYQMRHRPCPPVLSSPRSNIKKQKRVGLGGGGRIGVRVGAGRGRSRREDEVDIEAEEEEDYNNYGIVVVAAQRRRR